MQHIRRYFRAAPFGSNMRKISKRFSQTKQWVLHIQELLIKKVDAIEQRVTFLETVLVGVACALGMSAISSALLNI